MDGKSNKIDGAALERAINYLKKSLNEKEIAKLEETFSNKKNIEALASKFSERDLEEVLKVINNPDMMKKILGSAKAQEGLKKFLK